jgi:hypothetical protein
VKWVETAPRMQGQDLALRLAGQSEHSVHSLHSKHCLSHKLSKNKNYAVRSNSTAIVTLELPKMVMPASIILF